jgi:hypothetical protein
MTHTPDLTIAPAECGQRVRRVAEIARDEVSQEGIEQCRQCDKRKSGTYGSSGRFKDQGDQEECHYDL